MNAQSIISTALASMIKSKGGEFILSSKDVSDIDMHLRLAIAVSDAGYDLQLSYPQNKIQEVFSYRDSFTVGDGSISCLAMGISYCAVTHGNNITFWDRERKKKWLMVSNYSEIKWAKISAGILFTLSADNCLQKWSPYYDRQIDDIPLGGDGPISQIDISSCGKWLIIHRQGTWVIESWNVSEKKARFYSRITREDLSHLLFNTGNEEELFLVYGSPDSGSLTEFRNATTGVVNAKNYDHYFARTVAISDCGSYYAKEKAGKGVFIYHRDQNWVRLCQDGSYIRSMCFSPCSKYIATSGDDSVVKIWSVKDQTCVRKLVVATKNTHVSYLPDSSDWVYTVGPKNTVKIWEVK